MFVHGGPFLTFFIVPNSLCPQIKLTVFSFTPQPLIWLRPLGLCMREHSVMSVASSLLCGWLKKIKKSKKLCNIRVKIKDPYFFRVACRAAIPVAYVGDVGLFWGNNSTDHDGCTSVRILPHTSDLKWGFWTPLLAYIRLCEWWNGDLLAITGINWITIWWTNLSRIMHGTK